MLLRAVVILVVARLVTSETFLKVSNNEEVEIKSRNKAITKTVGEIISSFYLRTTSVLDFTSCSSDYESSVVTDDIISGILRQIDSTVAVLLEECGAIKKTDWKKVYNVFFVDSYDSFHKLFAHMTPEDYYYQGYYLIVLTQHFDGNNIKMMFEDMWSNYIINSNIVQLSAENQDECEVITYFPYTESHCEEIHPVVINTFKKHEGFVRDTKIFPNKMSNLFMCPISAAIFEVPPFLILAEQSELGAHGFEGFFLHQLADRMNFTLVRKTLHEHPWGVLYENGSSSGAIKMVMDKEVNLTGGFFLSSALRKIWMSSSYEYYTTNLVWAIPAAHPLNAAERFAKPFSVAIWLFTILVLIIGVIVICIINRCPQKVRDFIYGRNIKHPILNMINIALGGPLVRLPRRNFARTLLALYLIYTLVIRNAYSGALFRFLQMVNTHVDVRNMEEMLAKDYKFFVLEPLEEYVRPYEEIYKRTTLVDHSQFTTLKDLLFIPNSKLAFLASEDHVAAWNKKAFPHQFHEICHQKVTSVNLCLYMHKTSCLTPEINRNVFRFNSNGLMHLWLGYWVDKSYLQRKDYNYEPKKLTLNELMGGYYLFAFGLIVSFACFIVEILIKRIM